MFSPQYCETSYRVSKSGVKAKTETLADELAMYCIRVKMIIPDHYVALLTAGLINEPLERLRRSIPIERFGEPDEVGYAAVLLLSDRLSHYTTGTYPVIVGVLHLHPIPLFTDEQICRLNASSAQELDVKANAGGY